MSLIYSCSVICKNCSIQSRRLSRYLFSPSTFYHYSYSERPTLSLESTVGGKTILLFQVSFCNGNPKLPSPLPTPPPSTPHSGLPPARSRSAGSSVMYTWWGTFHKHPPSPTHPDPEGELWCSRRSKHRQAEAVWGVMSVLNLLRFFILLTWLYKIPQDTLLNIV